jgi:NhaA family Na+:H+ antiporter
VQPVLRLLDVEAFAGTLMLGAALLALVWANSPWFRAYDQLWATPFDIRLGSLIELELDLRTWVNDAAMALFFLLAGLEIKRQLVLGELRSARAAALPAVAALGGMVVPALLYVAINAGHPGSRGWGIPVATDIAFAVGVVAIAGRRIPVGARIFILTLAVVDDIGGIVVIALFYAQDVQPAWLLVALGAVLSTAVASRLEVRSIVPYVVLGVVCWLALHEAGVEAAIVGVVFGLLTPSRPFQDPATFAPVVHGMIADMEGRAADGIITEDERETNEVALEDIARFASETTSPLERVEGRLSPWVTLLIVPVFAFANVGVRLDLDDLDNRVLLGVVVGLVVGKTVGVTVLSWLAVRTGVGRLPTGVTMCQLLGLGATAGIGFTVSLFITSLSFDDPALLASAKVGVLVAAVVAGALGFLLLRAAGRDSPAR